MLMRVLLSKNSKNKLLDFLKKENSCSSLNDLARKMKIPYRTFHNWIYSKDKYMPKKIIPPYILKDLEIIEEKKDNWGQIKAGKKTYNIILKKYGIEEIRRRQSLGGKMAMKIKVRVKEEPLVINFSDPVFLEFYGALLGDGWLSKLKYKNKMIYLIGISGNRSLDREFLLYLKDNINKLFNRNAYLKERTKHNSIELNFAHKMLINLLHTQLDFPIGKKIDLRISDKIYNLGYEKIKHVIRGIFDTDGHFYFDKTPVGKPYPCIGLTMKAPRLMKQIHDILIKEGFKAYHNKSESVERIRLKGRRQIDRWMKEIGSSNKRNLDKIALVAQLDSAPGS